MAWQPVAVRTLIGGSTLASRGDKGLSWAGAVAPAHDSPSSPLLAKVDPPMNVRTATGCQAKPWEPAHRQVCQRGTWHGRWRVETVRSLLTTVGHGQQRRPRVWTDCRAHVAWTRTTVNSLAQWGLEVDGNDEVHLSIAKFSLCHTNTSGY